MAAVLEISDGSTTFDLLDQANHYLQRDGFAQQVAGVDYDDPEGGAVAEVLTLDWFQTDDDDKAATLGTLAELAAKARRFHALRLTYDFVWLKVQTHTETSAKYFILYDISINGLSPRLWSTGNIEMPLALLRRAASWDTQPDTYPAAAAAGATTIEPNINGAHENFDTVDDTELTGDVGALALVQLASFTATPETILLSMRDADTAAELDDFVPIINVDDHVIASTGFTKAPVTAAPDGQELTILPLNTFAGDQMCGAPLLGDLSNHHGTFGVYLLARAAASDIFKITVGHSTTGSSSSGSDLINAESAGVQLQTSTNFVPHYIGQINLPAGRRIDDLTDPANYYINWRTEWIAANGGNTLEVWSLWLVPVERLVRIEPQAVSMRVDGRHGLAYHYGAADVYVDERPALRGRIPTMPRNRHCRWYLFWWESDTNGGYDKSHTCSMTIYAINRWRALRGAG